jgi:hypothetical protein
MNALINPLQNAQQIVSWEGKGTKTDPLRPVVEPIANSAVVAEVEEQTFEVTEPLFWVDCADNIVAGQYWYNTQDQQIYPIENAPEPQLGTNGLQSV